MTEAHAKMLNPLSLAFLGDALFTFYVRERLIRHSDAKAGQLHAVSKRYVSAPAQADMYERLLPEFTEAEADIARRARNAHNATRAKNASLTDYKKATAFEAVIGFLHLTGQAQRLHVLLDGVLPNPHRDEHQTKDGT